MPPPTTLPCSSTAISSDGPSHSGPSPAVDTKDASVDACHVGIVTDPDCLGPCEPGTTVTLEGIVWNETENGAPTCLHLRGLCAGHLHKHVVDRLLWRISEKPPLGQSPPCHIPLAAARGSVRVRTRLVGRMGAEVRVSASFQKKFPASSK